MASTSLQSERSGYVAGMDDGERASRDEIVALQAKRIAWSLSHAYDNVTHYKKAFDKAGVNPKDFRQLSDLKNFPFTVKTDLRDNYPFNMFAVPREKLVRIHASSGTTGKPILVGYTRADIDTWSKVSAMYSRVTTIIATVSHFWSLMIASKPRMPAATITAATTRKATTLVRLPSPQPSRPNTVAVANVASETSTVSQPTSSR